MKTFSLSTYVQRSLYHEPSHSSRIRLLIPKEKCVLHSTQMMILPTNGSQIAAVPNQENEQFFTLKIALILQPLKDIMPDENPLRDKNPFGILSNDALIAYLKI